MCERLILKDNLSAGLAIQGDTSMKRWLVVLMCVVVGLAGSVSSQVIDGETEGEIDLSPISGIRAGHLEINPIMSMRLAGGAAVYQVGVALGYAVTRSHQLGGSFVMGNRLYDRTNRREVVVGSPLSTSSVATRLSIDQGFGSSLTGFYRYNVPYQIDKRTFPYLEVFGGRDFGWGDLSEAGAGVGFRRFVSRTTSFNTQYSYVALFADGGERLNRHVITAGFSVFFR
jgi:hypothetical protein